MEKRLLLVVDVQEDFVHGALPGDNAVKRIPNMEKTLNEDKEKREAVMFTQDTHFEDTYFETQEGKKLPILHCVKDTEGWEILSDLQEFITEDTKVIEKSTFGSIPMMRDVRGYLDQGYDEIELFGICTDICVINTAVLLKNSFSEVPIYVNAACSAGISEDLHNAALKTMESFQINIIR